MPSAVPDGTRAGRQGVFYGNRIRRPEALFVLSGECSLRKVRSLQQKIMPSRKTFSDISRTVSGLTIEIRREFSDRFTHLGSRVEELMAEVMAKVERRFGNEDDHVIFRALPEPAELTMTLSDVLRARSTQRTFSDEPLSDQDLSTILWAADGINRPNGRRTTPSALDWREIDIYVLKANGIWRWVPEKHGLIFCHLEDVRSETILAEPTLHIAPVHLVFVADKAKTDTFLARLGTKVAAKVRHESWPVEKLEEMRTRSMIIDAGVKVQAVYMAAAAMGLSCVARTGFDREKVDALLRLGAEETAVAIATLGYRPNSILDAIR